MKELLNEQFVKMQKIAGIKLNEDRFDVVVYYLKKLRQLEENNTADIYDLENLEKAISMYHEELLNKINKIK
jgi:hypothetical protein